MSISRIRNFALIAHVDHGKSTLADRLMEATGLLPPSLDSKIPRIDRMALEIERGVTIKLKAVRMEFQGCVLNMIDTPGHADFSYEVSRSLAACEGALLLVDATAGVQAQTLSHFESARRLGLAVVGVINKTDLPQARSAEVETQMRSLGVTGEIYRISALRGTGVEEVLSAIVARVPPPCGKQDAPFRALVFDSTFDSHLGALAYVRVVDGEIGDKRAKVRFLGTAEEAEAAEIGALNPARRPTGHLSAGEVGYLATGLRDPAAVRAGDTVALVSQLPGCQVTPLPGYQPPQAFVFASFFAKNAEFEEFRRAFQTLRLEEPAVSAAEVASAAFGRGFRLGFLGTFHLEIVRERLTREFGLELTVTKPTLEFPRLDREPWIGVTILTSPETFPAVAKLVLTSRGTLGETRPLGSRLKVASELPLLVFTRAFHDALKSVSHGFASLAWEFLEYRPAALAQLETLVHGQAVTGMEEVVYRDEAVRVAREKLARLKEILPRQQFSYAIQARVEGRIVAREDVPALSKDVLAKLSGGHVERKMKKLQEQKEGKQRLARFGRVEIPPEAFLV